jgi:hypothetical protein
MQTSGAASASGTARNQPAYCRRGAGCRAISNVNKPRRAFALIDIDALRRDKQSAEEKREQLNSGSAIIVAQLQEH